MEQDALLLSLAATVSKLVGRALGACLASPAAPADHTVVVELQQSQLRPELLRLRVCDDGLPMPAGQRELERCVAPLASRRPCPLIHDGMLLAQTTGHNEVVVRRYCLRPSLDGGGAMSAVPAGADAKPPGSTLCGSVLEATLQLQQLGLQLLPLGAEVAAGVKDGHGSSGGGGNHAGDGMGQHQHPQHPQQQELAPAAGPVVSCLQQLLGMVRVLAPPVRLLLRLNGVLLQGPRGCLEAVSGCRRMDLQLCPLLDGLARFGEGMASEFLPPPQAGPLAANPQQEQQEQQQHQEQQQQHGQAGAHAAAASAAAEEPGSEAEAAAAGPSHALPPPLPPPPLTFVGVGEAGWGCTGAVQSLRGCKWTARAGLVLQMPDHARLAAAAVTAAAGSSGGSGSSGSGGRVHQQQGVQTGGRQGASQAVPLTPVFLFRSWALQAEGRQHVLKGLEKCDWSSFGFQLGRAAASSEGGPLTAALQCSQPLSGAQLVAAVLHLSPCDYRAQAEGGKPPSLSASYEARLVRQALEAALLQLKQQCPGVVSSRRERSLAKALPLLSQSLAGILRQSAEYDGSSSSSPASEGTALEQACTMVGCQPEGLQEAIEQLASEAVAAAMAGKGAEAGSTE